MEYKRAYYIYFTKKKKHLFVQQWLEKMENECKQQDETAVLTVQHFPSISSLLLYVFIYILLLQTWTKQRFLFTKKEAQEEDRPARKYLIDDISP